MEIREEKNSFYKVYQIQKIIYHLCPKNTNELNLKLDTIWKLLMIKLYFLLFFFFKFVLNIFLIF